MLQKIRIKLKSYDHATLDQSASEIVRTARRTGAVTSGPVTAQIGRSAVRVEHGFAVRVGVLAGRAVTVSVVAKETPRPGVYRGAIIALAGNPVELVVATDINVAYLQTTGTTEPRRVFRVSERIALRIKDRRAIEIIT